MRARSALLVAALAACGGDDDRAAAPAPQPTLVAPIDAALPAAGGITEIPGYDPSSGLHLDDDDDSEAPPVRAGSGPRTKRHLEIVLRSTPPNAKVYVDDQEVGTTPTLWQGEFTGKPRDFRFILKGHALARYRFVPVTSGTVHARLIPVLTDDAGLAPLIVPSTTTPAIPTPTPRRRPPPADARPAPVTDPTLDAPFADAHPDAGSAAGSAAARPATTPAP